MKTRTKMIIGTSLVASALIVSLLYRLHSRVATQQNLLNAHITNHRLGPGGQQWPQGPHPSPAKPHLLGPGGQQWPQLTPSV